MSLFDELQEQMTLAIANLKKLNGAITVATDNLSTQPTPSDEVVVDKSAIPPKKKRASRKKAVKKVEPEVLDEAVEEEVKPEQPILPETQPSSGLTLDVLRTEIQTVAKQLNGNTQAIADLMQTRFQRKKLSEFEESEYDDLLSSVKGLLAIDDDPLG